MRALGWLVVILACACGSSAKNRDDAGATNDASSDAAIDSGIDAVAVDASPDAMVVPPGTLIPDPTFGTNGVATAAVGRSVDNLLASTVQADGKLLLAGGSQHTLDQLGQIAGEMLVVRLTTTGVPDTTFGAGGIATVPVGARAIAYAIAVQSDGKIVLVGEAALTPSATSVVAVRLMSDGALDTMFGTNGVTVIGNGFPGAVAISAAGSIFVGAQGGLSRMLVAKLTATGAFDSAFGNAGITTVAIGDRSGANALAFGPNNTVVAAGYTLVNSSFDVAVARLTSTGALDTSFSTDGIVVTPLGGHEEARAVAVDATGRVVIAGYGAPPQSSDDAGLLVRYEADGDIDPTFGGGDGVVLVDRVGFIDKLVSVFVRADTTIVTGGTSSGTTHRFLDDGSPDTTFGTNGSSSAGFSGVQSMVTLAQSSAGDLYSGAIALDNPNDRITLAVAKMSAAGVKDTMFGTSGIAAIASGASAEIATAVVANADGTIVAAGSHVGLNQRRAVVAKHLATGALDTTFGTGGMVRLTSIATSRALVATGGSVIVCGDQLNTGFAATKLTPAGAIDTTFGANGLFTDAVAASGQASPRAAAIDAQGNTVIVGTATGTALDGAAVRITPAGALDTTFSGDGRVLVDLGGSDEFTAVDIASNGTIVAAGFTNTGAAVVRFEPDGDLDLTFDTDGIAKPTLPGFTYVDRVRVMADGKIVVAGYRFNVNMMEVVVARLTTAGALDATFGTNGVVTFPVGPSLITFGNRWRGPDMLVLGSTIRVAATIATPADESMLLLTLDATDGDVITSATAGGRGFWTGFAMAATAGGGVVIAGRGNTLATGTDFGLARFKPAP